MESQRIIIEKSHRGKSHEKSWKRDKLPRQVNRKVSAESLGRGRRLRRIGKATKERAMKERRGNKGENRIAKSRREVGSQREKP